MEDSVKKPTEFEFGNITARRIKKTNRNYTR